MKHINLKIVITLLLCIVCVLPISAQARRGASTSRRMYGYISFPYNPNTTRRVPVYSNVTINKKLAFWIYQLGVYQVEPCSDSQQWYKLYDLDGKYLGFINTDYFRLSQKPTVPKDLEMVHVEGGTFDMGNNADPDASPVHKVTLSDYDIMKYEITIEQWRAIMGTPGSAPVNSVEGWVHQTKGNMSGGATTEISWNDVQVFLKILNKISGKKYRLPTEAEWEYAARGGKYSKGYKYSGSNKLTDVAVCEANSKDRISGRPTRHAVGLLAPNELGLYDMSGNMWEFCSDKYEPYPEAPQTNPHITNNDKEGSIVCRGGSFCDPDYFCETTKRHAWWPFKVDDINGFRLVLDCTNKAHKTKSQTSASAQKTTQVAQPKDTAIVYESKEPLQNGFFRVKKDGKFGLLAADGKEIISCAYSAVNDFNDGLAVFNDGQQYGAVNTEGKIVFPCAYESIENYGENMYLLKQGKKYCVKDNSGNTVIPLKYSRIGKPSKDGYYWAVFYDDEDDTYSGNYTLKKIGEGLAVVPETYKNIKVLHKDGTFFNGDLTETIPNPNEEYYYVGVDKKHGIIGMDIKTAVAYFHIGKMDSSKLLWAKDQDGKYRVLKNGEDLLGPYTGLYFKDSTGKIAHLPIDKSTFTSNDYYYVVKDKLWGVVDKSAKVLVEPQFTSISNFVDGLAAAGKDNTFGYIDQEGKVIIPFTYVEAQDFSEGLAAVRIEGKKGFAFIDKTGEIKIKPINCDSVGSFKNGECSITKGDKTYNIDINGKKIKN